MQAVSLKVKECRRDRMSVFRASPRGELVQVIKSCKAFQTPDIFDRNRENPKSELSVRRALASTEIGALTSFSQLRAMIASYLKVLRDTSVALLWKYGWALNASISPGLHVSDDRWLSSVARIRLLAV
jgi:hypothetical protein